MRGARGPQRLEVRSVLRAATPSGLGRATGLGLLLLLAAGGPSLFCSLRGCLQGKIPTPRAGFCEPVVLFLSRTQDVHGFCCPSPRRAASRSVGVHSSIPRTGILRCYGGEVPLGAELCARHRKNQCSGGG